MDSRAAGNAISDVVENRPRPLREFDQIYMKSGDMLFQSDLIARWADGKRLAFIGDGDAISVCIALLHRRGIVSYGPSKIVVFDFDERICNGITRFADKERLENLASVLYNSLDAFPGPTNFDCFYTNPPWGASNDGESVKVFVQRGMEATSYAGEGMVVIADDPQREWAMRVLANLQKSAIESGFYVEQMQSGLHSYHLDDDPDLRSCNLLLRALPGSERVIVSQPITDPARLSHFYGRDKHPRVRYVREEVRLDYGKANETEYSLELLENERE